MEYIGIVGSGENKFTECTKEKAVELIYEILSDNDICLISGRSPVGGIDIWAENIADEIKIPKIIYAPKVFQWNPYGQYGYKQRNIDIAKKSNILHCIVPRVSPLNYLGMRFNYCYHHGTNDHIKSGGCWTLKQALLYGNKTVLHIIND